MKTLGKCLVLIAFFAYGMSLIIYEAPVIDASVRHYKQMCPYTLDSSVTRIVLGILFLNAASMVASFSTYKGKLFILMILLLNMAFQGIQFPSMSEGEKFEAKLVGGRILSLIGVTILL